MQKRKRGHHPNSDQQGDNHSQQSNATEHLLTSHNPQLWDIVNGGYHPLAGVPSTAADRMGDNPVRA
jgi:hypothetical protein